MKEFKPEILCIVSRRFAAIMMMCKVWFDCVGNSRAGNQKKDDTVAL